MKSNVCYMLDEKGREDVLDAVEQTAQACRLTKKQQLQLRLTAEELMCFLGALPGEYEASFWLEQKKGRFELHLTAELLLEQENRKKILEAASQKNEDEVNGLVMRLSEYFVRSAAFYVRTKLLHQRGFIMEMDRCMQEACCDGLGVTNWSLDRYREAVDSTENVSEAQELAHSILAGLSDELYLCMRQNCAELIAIKKNTEKAVGSKAL